MSNAEFFPRRPDAHPMIYAYEENNPNYKGLLKVGYTKSDVERRVAQQYPTLRPGGVPCGSGKTSFFGPAPVPIHNDGNMPGRRQNIRIDKRQRSTLFLWITNRPLGASHAPNGQQNCLAGNGIKLPSVPFPWLPGQYPPA